MLLLAIHTAGPAGGVLLARCNEKSPGPATPATGLTEVLGAREMQPRSFSIQLIPAVAELLQASGYRLADVDVFAVVSGPGSFTGLRVGLSAVKAISEVTEKPIVAVSHLAMLAAAAARLYAKDFADKAIHVVLDASRGEFYHGMYREAGEKCEQESFQTLEKVTASIQSEPGLVVTSEPKVRNALTARGIHVREIPAVTVQDMVPLIVTAWQAGAVYDAADLDANYLRRSDTIVVLRSTGTKQAQVQGN